MKLTKNDKFYKYTDDGELIEIRLKRIKNRNTFVMYDKNDKEFVLNRDELKEYNKLRPHGYISFSCVGLDNGLRDVIVSYYKREDIDKEGKIPYIICRQNIIDIFNIGSRGVIGTSVSQSNCPKGIDFKTLIVARSIECIENVSYYITDSLDDILKPINTLNFDDLLKENKSRADMEEDTPPGFCSSLRQLIEENQFMFEVLLANNIYQVPHKIEVKDGIIDDKTKLIVAKLFKDIINPVLIEYDNTIDRSKIERDYYMLCDKDYDLYILTSLN